MNKHLNQLNTKNITTYGVGNTDPSFGQAQKCGGIKSVNEINIYFMKNMRNLNIELYWHCFGGLFLCRNETDYRISNKPSLLNSSVVL